VESSDISTVKDLKGSNFCYTCIEQIQTLVSFTATMNLVILIFQTTPSFQRKRGQKMGDLNVEGSGAAMGRGVTGVREDKTDGRRDQSIGTPPKLQSFLHMKWGVI